MNKKNWIFPATIAVVILGGSLPVQASIVMVSPPAPNRYVASAATSGITGGTISGGASSSSTFGVFGPATSTTPGDPGPLGVSSSSATQSSTTPLGMGPAISGAGSATASVSWAGFSGYSVMADSFFDVFFEVDLPGMYSLSGVVTSGGTFPPGSGTDSAEVRLVNNAAPAPPIFLEGTNPGDPGPDVFGVTLSLSPGITYRLTAQALVSRGGGAPTTASADASWDFVLVEQVPEPSTFVLAGLGLIGLGFVPLRERIKGKRITRGREWDGSL